MSHTVETIPSSTIKSLLNTQWNEYSGHVPKPNLVDVNDGTDPLRQNLDAAVARLSLIIIRVDTPAMEEIPIGNWNYVNRTTRILLDLVTPNGRQRLYDMMREVRRIIHANIHSVEGYQRVQFKTWNELTNEQMNFWHGRVILEVVNNAVLRET